MLPKMKSQPRAAYFGISVCSATHGEAVSKGVEL